MRLSDVMDDVSLPCPFGIIDDFEQWFEWHRRVYFYGMDPNSVSWDMLGITRRASINLDRALSVMADRIQGVIHARFTGVAS